MCNCSGIYSEKPCQKKSLLSITNNMDYTRLAKDVVLGGALDTAVNKEFRSEPVIVYAVTDAVYLMGIAPKVEVQKNALGADGTAPLNKALMSFVYNDVAGAVVLKVKNGDSLMKGMKEQFFVSMGCPLQSLVSYMSGGAY